MSGDRSSSSSDYRKDKKRPKDVDKFSKNTSGRKDPDRRRQKEKT